MKRLVALMLTVIMILGVASALADTWYCPDCGSANDGNFCSNCGTKKPAPKANTAATNIKVGDYVAFGRYEQNDYTADGAERIWWAVIDTDGDKLFLLSAKGLANLPFNKKSDRTAWAACSLRQWLNNDFLMAAFTKEERDAIQTTAVQDTAEHTYYEWNTKGRLSGTTMDKVFCLSFLEVRTLLTNRTIWCQPTATVSKSKNKIRVATGSDGNAYCAYWLRTSAYKNNAGVVWYDGNFTTAYEHYHRLCVRPALWVDASAVATK